MKTTLLITLSFLFLSLSSRAEFTNQKCSHVLTGSGEIQINRQWNTESGVCFIDLHPRNVVNMKYRDYYFDNRGNFLVFNVYGNGPDSEMTAARDFYLFPLINDYPDYSIEENGDVVVKMVSGHLFRISAKDFSIVSITPGTFTEKPLSPNNNGGVEIALSEGYWIDGGFRKGGLRMSNPKLSSIIKTSKSSKTCKILNKDLLDYDGNANFVFKYEKEALTEFLKTKCPNLSF